MYFRLPSYWVFYHIFESPTLLFSIILLGTLCLLPDFVIKVWNDFLIKKVKLSLFILKNKNDSFILRSSKYHFNYFQDMKLRGTRKERTFSKTNFTASTRL